MVPQAILPALAVAALVSAGAYARVERRTRPRWTGLVLAESTVGPPYRATTERVHAPCAPPIVRAAALCGIVVGSVSLPGVVWAMVTLRFDGLALALLPALGSTLGASWASLLLLARRQAAVDVARLTVLVARTSSVILLVLAALHFLAARLGWSDAASGPYTALATALALAALVQATLLGQAIARHRGALEGDRSRRHTGRPSSRS
ncbi:MAG TPA: hypothetical protein VE987_17230 [Polyangiaceae bacterium]|nr:hypothetical protein [Polyangiaceae bacterium]